MRIVRSAFLALLGGVLVALGCERGAPDPAPAPARTSVTRVVSLTPLASRFVIAIGASHRLLAVDPASAELPELSGLPAVDLAGALEHQPDLVLVAEDPPPGSPAAVALHRSGARIATFAPHDFEDVLALIRDVGAELVGADEASRFQAAFARPLARIGGSSEGQARPRVVAVVSFDPLVIAGGHSFETDLIEIAGGTSVTHPGEEPRLAIGADRWRDLAPDLVLVIGAPPAAPEAEQALRNTLPTGADVAFYAFDPSFWIDGSDEPARRLRAVIEPVSARIAARSRSIVGTEEAPR
jgi:ABC-type hemin transport system substrate-binding protein